MADWEGAGILLAGQQLLSLNPFDFTDFFNQGVRIVIIFYQKRSTYFRSFSGSSILC